MVQGKLLVVIIGYTVNRLDKKKLSVYACILPQCVCSKYPRLVHFLTTSGCSAFIYITNLVDLLLRYKQFLKSRATKAEQPIYQYFLI